MSLENPNDGIISIGESVMGSTGSLAVNRITVPNGPWVWELVLADANGKRVGDIALTTIDLRELRDLFNKAIAMGGEQAMKCPLCTGEIEVDHLRVFRSRQLTQILRRML